MSSQISLKFIPRTLLAGTALLALTALTGCHIDMWRQPTIHSAQRESPFFKDKISTRPIVAGTIARGKLKDDPEYFEAVTNNGKNLVAEIPARALNSFAGKTDAEKRLAMIKRGQNRFNIYCTPCHGKTGNGNGMIAQRGFALRRPPGNYHTKRLREMPIGHFYDVIANGYGTMYAYASRIQDVNDRWAVASYIRALQLSQDAMDSDIPEANRTQAEQELAEPVNEPAIQDRVEGEKKPENDRKSNSGNPTTAPPNMPPQGGTP